MYRGLVKEEIGNPAHCRCLGMARRDPVLMHASPGGGFDGKSLSPRVRRYLQSQLHSCSHAKIGWNLFFPIWVTGTVGPIKSSPTCCHPSLRTSAAAADGQAFVWWWLSGRCRQWWHRDVWLHSTSTIKWFFWAI